MDTLKEDAEDMAMQGNGHYSKWFELLFL
jgi:hypothetical protein